MAFFKLKTSGSYSVMCPATGHYLVFSGGEVKKVDDLDDIAYLESRPDFFDRCTATGHVDATDGVKPLSYTTIGSPSGAPAAPEAPKPAAEKKEEKKSKPKSKAKDKKDSSSKTSKGKGKGKKDTEE